MIGRHNFDSWVPFLEYQRRRKHFSVTMKMPIYWFFFNIFGLIYCMFFFIHFGDELIGTWRPFISHDNNDSNEVNTYLTERLISSFVWNSGNGYDIDRFNPKLQQNVVAVFVQCIQKQSPETPFNRVAIVSFHLDWFRNDHTKWSLTQHDTHCIHELKWYGSI